MSAGAQARVSAVWLPLITRTLLSAQLPSPSARSWDRQILYLPPDSTGPNCSRSTRRSPFVSTRRQFLGDTTVFAEENSLLTLSQSFEVARKLYPVIVPSGMVHAPTRSARPSPFTSVS